MSDVDQLPAKKDVARALLLKGTVFLHLDPRLPGVKVPSWLTKQPQLVLQVGLDMPLPIPDLRVDEAGVLGTLSFKGRPFTCVVPWSSVFAMVGDDGRAMVWPSSMPEEIAAEVALEASRAGLGTIQEIARQSGRGEPGEAPPERRQPRRSQSRTESRTDRRPPPPPPPRAMRPAFSVLRGGGVSASSAFPDRGGTGKRQMPPYLRVVK